MTTTRDELRKLAENATPSPWEAGEPHSFGDSDDKPQSYIDTPTGMLTWDDHGGEVFVPADAEFIAAARTALPALLDQLDAAEARIKAVQDALAHHPYGGPDQEDAIRRALDN